MENKAFLVEYSKCFFRTDLEQGPAILVRVPI